MITLYYIFRVTDENQKLKVTFMLSKRVKDLEALSTSLVYREQEVLDKYRDQLEEVDLEENTSYYEHKGLLLDSSSDDDSSNQTMIMQVDNVIEDVNNF